MKRLIVILPLVLAAAAPPVPRLLPVTDKDADKIRDGCETWFTQGETGYLFQAGRDFMIRTAPGPKGLQVCRMTDAQTSGFGDGPTKVSCGGLTLSIRQYGRATGSEEADSVQSSAVMTIGNGKATRTVRGQIGTAC